MRPRLGHIVCLGIAAGTLLSWTTQADCPAKPLSNQTVKRLVAQARLKRSDLPQALPGAVWNVQKRGCYYVYIEQTIPEAPDTMQTITLNPKGVVVDATVGNSPKSPLRCPDRIFSDRELATIIDGERSRRSALPPPYPTSEIRSIRARCLYEYFEYAIPSVKGMYHMFTIDPMGGLIDASEGSAHLSSKTK